MTVTFTLTGGSSSTDAGPFNISGTTMTVSGTGTNFLSSIGVGNKVGFEPNGNDYRVYEVISIDSDSGMTITGLTSVNLGSNTKMYYADWDEYSSLWGI